MADRKYYLCTFKADGEEIGYYNATVMDIHPIDYMINSDGLVLINHIEISREQYDSYVNKHCRQK